MANMFQMMKQAATMQRQMKQIQKELSRQTVDHTVGGGAITASACGDMTIKKLRIDPALLDPSRVSKLEDLLVNAVNGALAEAKKVAGEQMSQLAGSGGLKGLTDMLGG